MDKITKNYWIPSADAFEEDDESVVMFKKPLQIVGTKIPQWNYTKYDLKTTDVSQWDQIITANHGNDLQDVIGKAIGLEKNDRGIFIQGIKYAINENPLAILARNLLTAGFATGFSCETIGPEPDENGIFRDHILCGLSQVTHPNDKLAYAVVANSRNEVIKSGLDVQKFDKFINENQEGFDEFGRPVTENAMYDQLGRLIK